MQALVGQDIGKPIGAVGFVRSESVQKVHERSAPYGRVQDFRIFSEALFGVALEHVRLGFAKGRDLPASIGCISDARDADRAYNSNRVSGLATR